MSDTRHHRDQHKKNWGTDLWGKRPMAGLAKCSENKKLCRRKERNMGKIVLHKIDEGTGL